MANEPADRLEPADVDGLVDGLFQLAIEAKTSVIAGEVGKAGYLIDQIPIKAVTAIRSLQARCAELEKHLRIALDTMKMHGICGEECFACEDAARTLTKEPE